MKKFVTFTLAAALVVAASSVVYANVCAFDAVPAATLLFPFVALDYNNPVDGSTTLFAITNVSSEAQIVHITLWSDVSIGVLDFNVVLSGYDVQTMNIRDILYLGNLPITGTASPYVVSGGVDQDGPYDDPYVYADPELPDSTATLYDRCNPVDFVSYPGNYAGGIPQSTLDLFKTKLQFSQTFLRAHTDCANELYSIGDWFEGRTTADATWMYITADVVWTCNKMFPDGNSQYWSDGPVNNPNFDEFGAQRLTDNVIIGDVIWVNNAARFSEADNAVHIEADVNLGAVASANPFSLGDHISFYERYAGVLFDAQDYREPLPTAWAFRYLGYQNNDFGTFIRAWKGSTAMDTIQDLFLLQDDGLMIAWDDVPYTYYAWDEDENVIQGPGEDPWSGSEVPPGLRPNLLPLETQEVSIDQFQPLPGENGWMLFVWPWSNGNTDPCDPQFAVDAYQTWMGVKYNAFGQYSMFLEGAVMANYNCFSNQILPDLAINYDYVTPAGYVVSPTAPGAVAE